MTTLLLPVNLGSYANDGTGDDLRTAFTRVNNSFSMLIGEANISNAVNLGTGLGIFANKNLSTLNLEFKSLTSNDNSVVLNTTSNTIDLSAKTKIQSDTNPYLGNDLNLNNNNIVGGGDVRTTVWGIDLRILNATIELLVQSGGTTVDLGTISNPTGQHSGSPAYTLDMGPFVNPFGGPVASNVLDFGGF